MMEYLCMEGLSRGRRQSGGRTVWKSWWPDRQAADTMPLSVYQSHAPKQLCATFAGFCSRAIQQRRMHEPLDSCASENRSADGSILSLPLVQQLGLFSF